MAGKGSWAERVTQSLARVWGRFPAVTVLACVATGIGVLQVMGVPLVGDSLDAMDFALGLDELPDDPLTGFVAFVQRGCLFALPVVVAVQCALERARVTAAGARKAQAVAATVSVCLYLAGTYLFAWLGRSALWLMLRFGVDGVATCLAVYFLMDRANEDVLVPRLCVAALFSGLLCSLLFAGLGIICLVVAYLLGLEDLAGTLFEVASLLCWTLLYPNLLVSQLPTWSKEIRVPKAWGVVVGYVVLPLCLLLLGVLYLYIGRILVVHEMPVGEMNWFGSFALLVFVFLWLCARADGGGLGRWFVRWGWALLVPVVAVQVFGVVVRVGAYGLTPARYASCLWIATGLGVMALAALGPGRARPGAAALVGAAVAFVAFVSPLNVLDVPNVTQALRLHRGLDAAEASGREAQLAVAGAWDFLRGSEDGYLVLGDVAKLRERADEGETFEELFGFERPQADGDEGEPFSDVRDWWWVEYNADGAALDVAGFSRVYRLHDAEQENADDLDAGAGAVLEAVWDDGTRVSVDVRELLETLAERRPSTLEHAPDDGGMTHTVRVDAKLMRVDAGEGRVLVLKQVVRTVDASSSPQDAVTVEGYLLVP